MTIQTSFTNNITKVKVELKEITDIFWHNHMHVVSINENCVLFYVWVIPLLIDVMVGGHNFVN